MLKEPVQQLQGRLDEVGADALLVTALPNIRWAVGFTGSNALLLVRRTGADLLTDGRYRIQASEEVEGAAVHVPGYDLVGHLAGSDLLGGVERLAVQADDLRVAAFDDLRERLDGVTLVPVRALATRLVAAKTDAEIERIRAAQRVTEAVFEEVLERVRPGVSEQEIAAAIVYGHLRRGAERMAFDPIVASGPNGALPHARPGDRRIEPGDLVVIDMGGVVDGYASDMTRTVAVGAPGEEERAVYDLVRRAQQAALDAARSGMPASSLDAAARDVIDAAGYGVHFSHSLGHGIGLETHEWPSVSFRSDEPLPERAAVTIEPGVYVPGRFGVRIEDIVVLRPDGCDNLTRATTDLIVLPR